MTNNSLSLYVAKTVKNLSLRVDDEVKKYNLNKITEKKIINALEKGIIDSFGRIVFPKETLITLLALNNKRKIEYIVDGLRESDIVVLENKTCIDSAELIKMLIQRKRKNIHQENFKAIYEVLCKIQDDPVVKYECSKHQGEINNLIKNLKSKKIKEFKICFDELTGKKLKRNSEFHHIREKGIAGNEKYQLNIKLGVIINQDIHKDITKKGIDNEKKLLVYCKANKYKIDWYDIFIDELKTYK